LRAGEKVTIEVVLEANQLSGPFTIRDAVGSSSYDPRLVNNVVRERVHIQRPLPLPPRPIVGPPS
jgi:hypothetical protein